MKAVPQDKAHCFKHACTYPAAQGICPYCKLDRLVTAAPKGMELPLQRGCFRLAPTCHD